MRLKHYLSLGCFFLVLLSAYPQCIPGDSISCPDPEDNGQICPDTIAPVYRGVDYSQEITFLAPSRIDTFNISVDVHHLSLISIEGLPEGIDWVTNAENDEFFPEIYYCILISGNTTADTGTYPLSIVVDVYAWVLGQVVKVVQVKDSTSLSMKILDEASSTGDDASRWVTKIWPNPFTSDCWLEVEGLEGNVELEVINILGERVYSSHHKLNGNLSRIHVDASLLADGIYFIRLSNGVARRAFMVSKRQ